MVDGKSIGVILGSFAATFGMLALVRKSKSKAERSDFADYNEIARERLRDFDYTGFKTDRGLRYNVIPSSKDVVRINAAAGTLQVNPPESMKSDPHYKTPSIVTYFVNRKDADRIGNHQDAEFGDNQFLKPGETRVLTLRNGALFPLIRTKSGEYEMPQKDFKNPIPFTTVPMTGLHPVELWNQKYVAGDRPIYEGFHAGDAIEAVYVEQGKRETPGGSKRRL